MNGTKGRMGEGARGRKVLQALLFTLSPILPLAPSAVWAQSNGSVVITVTPSVTKSLTVALTNGATSQDLFNGAGTGPQTLLTGTTAYNVTNTGNIQETFVLSIATETDPNPGLGSGMPSSGFPWHGLDTFTASLAGTTDTYEMFAVFATTTTTPAMVTDAAHLVTHAGVAASATQYANNQTGSNVSAVPGTNVRGLFFAIKTGAFTTTVTTKHIGVMVAVQ